MQNQASFFPLLGQASRKNSRVTCHWIFSSNYFMSSALKKEPLRNTGRKKGQFEWRIPWWGWWLWHSVKIGQIKTLAYLKVSTSLLSNGMGTQFLFFYNCCWKLPQNISGISHWGKNLQYIENSHFENLIFHKNHNFKVSFFTKIIISNFHFSLNSQFQSLIFHKIHNFKISFFTKFTISKYHFSQNSHFSNLKFLVISR